MLTCTNLPTKTTKLQAMLLFFNRSVQKPRMYPSFFSKIKCHPFLLQNPLLNYVTNCEDLDIRHIPQKINELASLALGERYIVTLVL